MFQYTLRFNDRTVLTDRSAGQPALDRLIDALGPFGRRRFGQDTVMKYESMA